MERWHAGLRVTSERTLSPLELEELAEVRRAALKHFVTVVLRLVLLLLIPFAMRILPFSPFFHELTLLVSPILLVAVVASRMPGSIVETVTLPIRLRRDLKARRVETCVGTRGELITGAEDLPDWQIGSSESRDDQQCLIEVLPQSHLLWSVEGERPSELRLLQSSVTAQAPQHAELAAQYVRPVEAGAPLLIHSRPLSFDELRELESYAPRPAVVDLALPLVFCLTGIVSLILAVEQNSTSLFAPFALALGGAVTIPRALRSIRTRRWIAPDVREGRVVIVRWKRKDANGEEELSPPVEFLPHSKVVWSERSGPAPWRRIISGAGNIE